MNTTIKPVEDNYDKYYTYTVLIDQLNKSIEAGFYMDKSKYRIRKPSSRRFKK